MSDAAANGRILGDFIAGTADRTLAAQVLDQARLCLTDWMAVAVGAGDEDAGRIVRDTVRAWQSAGRATVLFGAPAAAPMAALANGTLAHCLDFDDTYVDAVTHTSAPVWAATLALGETLGSGEAAMLSAFVTGFEVAARVGRGLGQAVTARGWHGTGVFGRIGAAAAAAALLGLDAGRARHALALAATQTSGLTASFGTMAKPFHAGKAAMDGILAAELAAAGMTAAPELLEAGGGLDRALIQDQSLSLDRAGFAGWKILENSFKPYAACHLTHPAVDAARAADAAPAEIVAAEATVAPLALQITGQTRGQPESALAGKFDLKYCVALGLHGYDLSAADFAEPWQCDATVAETAAKIRVSGDPAVDYAAARLKITTADDREALIEVPVGKGHPGNPMGWDDMASKFGALVAPRLDSRAGELFGLLRDFGTAGGLAGVRELVSELRAP
jgi:2-methylcitrate dehydratase PrpD